MDEHLYIVAYDIADPRRWRKVFKLMNGYGAWVQLSVFQCRMNRRRQAQLLARLDRLIDHKADHVVLVDVGVADTTNPRVTSLGKPFHPLKREPVIV
ncbi:MAG: CRISPR-associated endonuclease Cas2 [Spirochaetaceae bacterium]|nr:CRISPR-associated endonuclease Cas2 [Spirochaetaceae bacterium]